jgi:hypothetical protein
LSPPDVDCAAYHHGPFVRDGNEKLVRRFFWLDMDDRTLVMVMTQGIGANLTNDEKRAHLAPDLVASYRIQEWGNVRGEFLGNVVRTI